MKLLSLPIRALRKAYRIVLPRVQKVSDANAQKIYDRAVKTTLESVDGRELQTKLNRLVEEIWNERFSASVASRYQNIDEYVDHITKTKKKLKKPKVAIFTAVSGNYESVKLPEIFTENADYHVFTDDESLALPDIYTVHKIPYFNADATRIARYVKTHPHILLPGYDIALWLDSNITPITSLQKYVSAFAASDKTIGLVDHPLRTTVNQEAEACIRRSKDSADSILTQIKHYGNEATKPGLYETSFYIVNLQDAHSKQLMNTWWTEIDNWSRRDQLSLPHAIQNAKANVYSLLPPTKSVRNNPDFILNPHDSIANKLIDTLTAKILTHFKQAPIQYTFASDKSSYGKKLDVIVCVHNALQETKACIASVLKHTTALKSLIIIDDGSNAPTRDYLRSFAQKHQNVILKRNITAQRYTKAANKGLRTVSAPYAVLLNSDTIVTPHWDIKMLQTMHARPDIAVVGPLSNAASVQSIPNTKSSNGQTAVNPLPTDTGVDDMNDYLEQWSPKLKMVQVPLIHGFCYMVRTEILKTVGYLDEKSFPRGYGEENDYCLRVTNAGHSLAVASNTYVYHKKSASYLSKERRELMKKGREVLLQKHTERRINNAVESMRLHPELERVRTRAAELY